MVRSKQGDVVEIWVGEKYKGAWIIEDNEMLGENEKKLLLKRISWNGKIHRTMVLKEQVVLLSYQEMGTPKTKLVAKLLKLEEMI